jgi:hypothetical protein
VFPKGVCTLESFEMFVISAHVFVGWFIFGAGG